MAEGGKDEIQSFFERMSISIGSTSLNPKSPSFNVLRWNRKYAQKFGIYYAKDFLSTPSEVLMKAGKIDDFTHEQRIYMETMKDYLRFDALYEKQNEDFQNKVGLLSFYTEHLGPLFKKIRKSVYQDMVQQESKEEQSLSYLYAIARHNVISFIEELAGLLKVVHKSMNNYTSNLPKDVYSELFHSFVNMCYLKVRLGSASPTHWYGLYSHNVTSKPDYRLMNRGSFGVAGDQGTTAVVSVVKYKIKKGKQQREYETDGKWYNSSVSSDTSSDGSRSHEASIENISEIEKLDSLDSSLCSSSSKQDVCETLQIEQELGTRVLGQHAGELLLDFKSYSINNTMPGVIVYGTKVYFTLLEMSGCHFFKLFHNKELDKDKDQATIYYSRPLNILVEDDRNILIESFMLLNNLKHGKEAS